MDHDHSLLFGMASIGAASSVVVGRTPQIAVLAQAVLGVGIEKRVPPVGPEQPLDIEPAPAKAGVPMASPRAAASVRSLSGVRLAIAWCAGGMCSLVVVWCALAALRG